MLRFGHLACANFGEFDYEVFTKKLFQDLISHDSRDRVYVKEPQAVIV